MIANYKKSLLKWSISGVVVVTLAGFMVFSSAKSQAKEGQTQIDTDIPVQVSIPKTTETCNEVISSTSETNNNEKLLNSLDRYALEGIAYAFTNAYLSADIRTMKQYLINPESKEHDFDIENLLNDAYDLKLKVNSVKEEKVIVEYEFAIKGQDTLQYLYLIMKKVNNQWKVDFFGRDA